MSDSKNPCPQCGRAMPTGWRSLGYKVGPACVPDEDKPHVFKANEPITTGWDFGHTEHCQICSLREDEPVHIKGSGPVR